jgi:hypothetical protein
MQKSGYEASQFVRGGAVGGDVGGGGGGGGGRFAAVAGGDVGGGGGVVVVVLMVVVVVVVVLVVVVDCTSAAVDGSSLTGGATLLPGPLHEASTVAASVTAKITTATRTLRHRAGPGVVPMPPPFPM